MEHYKILKLAKLQLINQLNSIYKINCNNPKNFILTSKMSMEIIIILNNRLPINIFIINKI
jgi:hypothetical protein